MSNLWEPTFIAEIAAGKDPRIAPDRETKAARSTTVADLLAFYRTRYVDVEPLKSRSTIVFNISQSLCSQIVRGDVWNPATKLTTGDEMRDRIIGALDTGCRRGEMMKIQNAHVDWRHRWIRI